MLFTVHIHNNRHTIIEQAERAHIVVLSHRRYVRLISLEENVVQPLLVSTSAIKLAAETVRSIMKVDDIVRYTYVLQERICYLTLFDVFVQINAR